MKPAPFAYHAPRSVEECLALLAEHGDEATVLAGGQSLVPAMNARRARPRVLVDINRVAGLDGVVVEGEEVRIGSMVRHAALEHGAVPGRVGGLLSRIASHIAHPPVRARGTIGGSLANADPSAEWSLMAVTLGARIGISGPTGARVVAAESFCNGPFATALMADELITEVVVPGLQAETRFAFLEISPRTRDFAIAAVVVVLTVSDGVIAEARIGIGGASPTPVRAHAAETALRGGVADAATFAAASREAVRAIAPYADVHATADYRRDIAGVLCRRALTAAAEGA